MDIMDHQPTPAEDASLAAAVLAAALTHDAAEDFTLPDYMPAIRRIVSVDAHPLPETRFLTGAAVEFGGTLALSVLYVGEDGALFCAPLTCEYSASAAPGASEVADAARIGIDTSCESVSCRATAPRRLSLRCRMRTRLFCLAPHAVACRVKESGGARLTTAEEASVERLELPCADTVLARGEATSTVGGTLPLAADARLICAQGAIRIERAEAAADSVAVQGEAIVTALVLRQDGRYEAVTAKAPLAETVSVPGARAGDAARATGRAAAVTVQAAQEGGAPWEIEFDLEAEAARPETRTVTADAYSSACTASAETEETDSLTLLRCGTGSLTVSGEGGRQNKPEADESVLAVSVTASPDHVERQGKRLILHGVCSASVRLLSGGEVVSEEFTFPFRYEANAEAERLPADDAELLFRCAAEATGAQARLDGDKIRLDAELCVSMTVLAREKVRFVRTLTLDRASPRTAPEGVVRIVYPDPGEPLWEIGKRCGAPFAALRAANGIAESAVLCDGAPLILP